MLFLKNTQITKRFLHAQGPGTKLFERIFVLNKLQLDYFSIKINIRKKC